MFPQSNRHDDSTLKLERIRKSIFHDVLSYNREAAQSKRRHDKELRDRELQELHMAGRRQQQALLREQETKRNSIRMQREELKREYEREIRQKKIKQQKEKDSEKVYADLAYSYQRYQNQRRLYDLERIYNRRRYQAKIIQPDTRRFKTEMGDLQDKQENSRVRLHTENDPQHRSNSKKKVTFADEESPVINVHLASEAQQKYNIRNGHRHQDSIDRIQQRESAGYETPRRGIHYQ